MTRASSVSTQAEADRIAGWDADYHQRDLYEAIEHEEFPSWSLHVQVMPFDAAKTYRFNPFDLTKVWPHSDYPLTEVGRLTLNRNVTDYHTEMEQAAFQPNNTVPGTGLSPDKMLLARGFSYADAHRARLGVNYQQIPVNRPRSAVRSYSKDGVMRVDNVSDPVYYPNSFDRAPAAYSTTYAEQAVWAADGEMVRAAYTLHPEDDDFGQARTLLTEVMDDAARDRLIDTVSNILSGLRREEVLQRAFAVLAKHRSSGGQRDRGSHAREAGLMENPRAKHEETENVALMVDSVWLNDKSTSVSRRVVKPTTSVQSVPSGHPSEIRRRCDRRLRR